MYSYMVLIFWRGVEGTELWVNCLGGVQLVRGLRMAAGQLVGSEIHRFHTLKGTDINSSSLFYLCIWKCISWSAFPWLLGAEVLISILSSTLEEHFAVNFLSSNFVLLKQGSTLMLLNSHWSKVIFFLIGFHKQEKNLFSSFLAGWFMVWEIHPLSSIFETKSVF